MSTLEFAFSLRYRLDMSPAPMNAVGFNCDCGLQNLPHEANHAMNFTNGRRPVIMRHTLLKGVGCRVAAAACVTLGRVPNRQVSMQRFAQALDTAAPPAVAGAAPAARALRVAGPPHGADVASGPSRAVDVVLRPTAMVSMLLAADAPLALPATPIATAVRVYAAQAEEEAAVAPTPDTLPVATAARHNG